MSLNGEILEEVDYFKYLGAIVSKKSKVGAKVSGAMSRI